MIVRDLDLVGVTFSKLKANTPTRVHAHCPLISAFAFQLVQADALEWTEIAEGLGDVQRQQQIDRRLKVEPAKLVRPIAFPNLAGHGIAPRPDHGINILRQTVKSNGCREHPRPGLFRRC